MRDHCRSGNVTRSDTLRTALEVRDSPDDNLVRGLGHRVYGIFAEVGVADGQLGAVKVETERADRSHVSEIGRLAKHRGEDELVELDESLAVEGVPDVDLGVAAPGHECPVVGVEVNGIHRVDHLHPVHALSVSLERVVLALIRRVQMLHGDPPLDRRYNEEVAGRLDGDGPHLELEGTVADTDRGAEVALVEDVDLPEMRD